MWRGKLSIRRAAALTSQLPPGSSSWRAIHADASWTQGDYLLAAIFDRLGTKDSKPYPRPADSKKKAAGDARARMMAERFKRRQERRRLDR